MAAEEPLAYDPPMIYKTFFDNPTLSDLTIKLSARSVHVHRIVLCRGSEYFTSLLTGRFEESKSKEIELHDDDPEAMMAVLRYLYGLDYTSGSAELDGGDTVLPHAVVYTTAEKYQIKTLQGKVHKKMSIILNWRTQYGDPSDLADLINTVRTIIAGTLNSDREGQLLLVTHCISHLAVLKTKDEFIALLREVADLGAEIIRFPHN